MTMSEIADRCGYHSVPSFTRAFERLYGLPPARYRQHGSHARFQTPVRERMDTPYEVSIATLPSLDRIDVAGRDYAVLVHTGPYANMRSAYRWLYGHWLPASGRETANEPVFEEYLNSPRETSSTNLITKVCLPLL